MNQSYLHAFIVYNLNELFESNTGEFLTAFGERYKDVFKDVESIREHIYEDLDHNEIWKEQFGGDSKIYRTHVIEGTSATTMNPSVKLQADLYLYALSELNRPLDKQDPASTYFRKEMFDRLKDENGELEKEAVMWDTWVMGYHPERHNITGIFQDGYYLELGLDGSGDCIEVDVHAWDEFNGCLVSYAQEEKPTLDIYDFLDENNGPGHLVFNDGECLETGFVTAFFQGMEDLEGLEIVDITSVLATLGKEVMDLAQTDIDYWEDQCGGDLPTGEYVQERYVDFVIEMGHNGIRDLHDKISHRCGFNDHVNSMNHSGDIPNGLAEVTELDYDSFAEEIKSRCSVVYMPN